MNAIVAEKKTTKKMLPNKKLDDSDGLKGSDCFRVIE
jgi:hypothetical protein